MSTLIKIRELISKISVEASDKELFLDVISRLDESQLSQILGILTEMPEWGVKFIENVKLKNTAISVQDMHRWKEIMELQKKQLDELKD